MFKWVCLAVATAFLGAVAWMLNDVRLEVKRTSQTVNDAGATLNADLPDVMAKARKAADALGDDVPEILAELTADMRTLKEVLGGVKGQRDPDLLRYAGDLLNLVGSSKATVGVKPAAGGGGLRQPARADQWVLKGRREADLLTLLKPSPSKADLVRKLTSNSLGAPYFMELADRERVPMLDWLKANHPETKALFE